ncbi:putative ABC transport system ATP-binding protein [Planifilum fimeticola]|jgi:putative ABC transport system ATP-binding protein|uniref:Putative ABC transport system ATP-binding protein n=1 Tax=Planifilum fimeticola TaxID=201975 RepID=A0A2T0LH10_9BACL|nr:ABC transporter ATP-binding protein [Planifilum fimeticola]PRX41577.1 putative ABC transport system ATP-binding protein [Planifilum fimeticola]
MEPIVEADELWKIFGDGESRVEALRGVSLSVFPGEMVAVMGPSGCGKTTLLNVLSGIDTVTRGRVRIRGRDLHGMKERERDRCRAEQMGFVFQSYNLIPVLSAVENVELPLLATGVPAREARRRAEEALARVGLKERRHHRPAELSGGQAQRVALARAIVNRPAVVFADEPTGALDRKTTELVIDLLDHLNRVDGLTMVLVTHDPEVAERAHRILYMDSGQILRERSTKRQPPTLRSAGREG